MVVEERRKKRSSRVRLGVVSCQTRNRSNYSTGGGGGGVLMMQ